MTVTPRRYMDGDTVLTHAYDKTVEIPGGGGSGTSGAREVLDWLAGEEIGFDVMGSDTNAAPAPPAPPKKKAPVRRTPTRKASMKKKAPAKKKAPRRTPSDLWRGLRKLVEGATELAQEALELPADLEAALIKAGWTPPK